MPDLIGYVIGVVQARPLTSALLLIIAILYIRYMKADPKAH